MPAIIELHDVVKQYHNHLAVDKLCFEVPEGSLFGMLGPNGAGKTSAIRIITSITRADSGRVLFRGEPLRPAHSEQIGYMPEERGLYKKMKVGEEILYLAQLKGMSSKNAKTELDYWLKRLDIESWRDKKVEELSKGMQQKIQFVCTVIHRPRLLILDEPFSGLDPINSNLIRDEIDELHRNGTTILFSTHRMEQVEEICERIVLINKGRNVLDGTVSEVKERYKEHRFLTEYAGELPAVLPDYAQELRRTERLIEVRLKPDTPPNQWLQWLLEQGLMLRSFNEVLPSLNEIFIRTVQHANS